MAVSKAAGMGCTHHSSVYFACRMKGFTWLVVLSSCLLLPAAGAAQVPISSIYQHLKDDASPVVKAVYQLLHRYYESRIKITQLEAGLNGCPQELAPREKAVLNMALSYIKVNDEDFGFYNLRLAVSDAETLPDNDIVKGVVFAEFGNYLYGRETHDLAIEFLKRSIPILDACKPKDMEGSGFSLQNKILRSYTELGEQDSVTMYMDKVIAHARTYKDRIWLSSAYNNKGYRFYEEHQYDSALACYRLAQSYLNPAVEDHIIFFENISENIAHIHARKKEYTRALAILDKVIDTRLQYAREVFSALQALNYYTDYCGAAGLVSGALARFNQSVPRLKLSGKNFEASVRYLNLRMKLAKLAGNREDYLHYFNLLLEKEKERLSAERQMLARRKGLNKYIKSRNDVFEQQLEIEKLQKAKLRQSVAYRNLFIIIVLLLSAVVGCSIYASGRYKKQLLQAENEQLQQREHILDLENMNLKNNIEIKEKDISRVVADNKLRTAIKKAFLKKLDELSKTEEANVKGEIRKLRSGLVQTVDQHDKMDLLQHNIEEINARFEGRLRQTIPAITHSELEICSLIRLGYNNTEIAGITNKTPENIRVNKFRIKQKAGLNDMKDLECLIMSC